MIQIIDYLLFLLESLDFDQFISIGDLRLIILAKGVQGHLALLQ